MARHFIKLGPCPLPLGCVTSVIVSMGRVIITGMSGRMDVNPLISRARDGMFFAFVVQWGCVRAQECHKKGQENRPEG